MNNKIKTVVITGSAAVVIGAGAVLAAGGGASSPAAAPGAAAAAPPAASPDSAPSAASVASSIGATGVTPMDPTLFASSEATAMYKGRTVDIATFGSQSLRDQWVGIASQYGPIITEGDNWAVTTG